MKNYLLVPDLKNRNKNKISALWHLKKQNSIIAFYSETIDLFGDSVDITQEIYEDGGELVREVNVLSANTGKIKFFYREID